MSFPTVERRERVAKRGSSHRPTNAACEEGKNQVGMQEFPRLTQPRLVQEIDTGFLFLLRETGVIDRCDWLGVGEGHRLAILDPSIPPSHQTQP